MPIPPPDRAVASPPDDRGSRPGLRALAEVVNRVAVPLTRGRRLIAAELAAVWPEIVGDSLATQSHPDRTVFPPKRRAEGTLHVRVGSGVAALELQHAEALVCQRINAWLGYAAVVRLRLVHAPLPVAAQRPVPPPRPVELSTEPAVSLAGIDSPRLRETLARLARQVGRITHDA